MVAGLTAIAAPSTSATAAGVSIGSATIPLLNGGTTSISGGSTPAGTAVTTEIDSATAGGDTKGAVLGSGTTSTDRNLPGSFTGSGPQIRSHDRDGGHPELGTNFQGLNFHDQRYANGGNQFSVEPPDQGLCAGRGFIVEAVNDVLRVYHSNGTPATPVTDLNTFYGYAAAINRTTGAYGPEITDPSCLFDQSTGRFIVTVLTLDRVGTTSSLAGTNHLDIAVSNTSDPTGTWSLHSIPVQNNGTQGTPDHGCAGGYCLGDYPHIGADANGFYITTNEFALFANGFYGAQVYAMSKEALVSGTLSSVLLFDTAGAGPDGAGFTVWPATVPGHEYAGGHRGTQYFLSSDAVFSNSGASSQLLLWTMTNTRSLDSATPAPVLAVSTIPVDPYAVPSDWASQKAGDRPLSSCLVDTTIDPVCWQQVGAAHPDNTTWRDPNGGLNNNDSRMQQVVFADGKLWGSLDTDVVFGTDHRSGIAYYAINPNSGKVLLQGQAGVAHTDLTYPAVGLTDSGRGIISFTLTGDNNYPSAAYASLSLHSGMGAVKIAAAGVGPWDGFTEYVNAFGSGVLPARWGDYGATAVMGNSIWAASEYIAQTCTYTAWLADHTCGGTRGTLGNWSTHISQLKM